MHLKKSFIHIALAVVMAISSAGIHAQEIRIGIIGLDTSHVTAFTKLINDPKAKDHVPGAKVIAAYRGGSDDIESSYSRLDKFTKELQENYGVKIVDTIEELCTLVDAILLESVDGRPHLAQVTPVFEAGLPVFIDKPLAGSLRDAIEIKRLGEKHDVPWFSSSSYRYYKSMTDLMAQDVGEIRGAMSYGPASLEPTHPDLFWYAVHPTEALFTALGTGCETVTRITTKDTDVVTGIWSGGRVGTLRGLRNASTPHKVILFGTKKVAEQKGGGNYAPLVVEIIKFFKTKVPPISPEETIELFAFMEAADESKRQGGKPVSIEYVMKKAGE
ncbi:Gfo/Idh/MocA family oxidoreductase [bacterium AH-315-P07]|nr:Gfo/Idh/MocA family oxidoreductase [bacterium AH-315-P07]MBN4046693.1 Gfo/Idh/MocA family oxidoreductase [bacterium AH-315-P07]